MSYIDDSNKVIAYYESYFENHKDKSLLALIMDLMCEWSKVVKTSRVSEEQFVLFEKSLKHSHQFIWYETGSRLSKLMNKNKSVEQLFRNNIRDDKLQSRFNIVALIPCMDKQYHEEFIRIGLRDKSQKVRSKLCDVVLTLQQKKYLKLLKKHLLTESNSNVIESINFTLISFNKMDKNEDSSISITI